MLFALEGVTVVPAGGRSRAVTTSVTVLFLQKPVWLLNLGDLLQEVPRAAGEPTPNPAHRS